MTIKMYQLIFLSVCNFFVYACVSVRKPNSRIPTIEEMNKFGINGGIIHDVKICPNKFDDQNQKLIIVGDCEIVNCKIIDNKSICHAEKIIHQSSKDENKPGVP